MGYNKVPFHEQHVLQFSIMAYHGTKHSTTGFTPLYLLHGREINLPSREHLSAKLDPKLRGTEALPRLENLKQNLKRAYRTVRQNLESSCSTNKKYYDRKAKDRTFEPGTIVYLHNPVASPQLSRKFRIIWAGPYRIL
jgi:hypothetical protein